MSLRIHGNVCAPRELGFEDLRSLPAQVDDVGTVIPGRRGGAVRLLDVLALASPEGAEVSPAEAWLTVEADDGEFSASVPLDALQEALLVYCLEGEPLPRGMGGPFRLLIPEAARCGRAELDDCANVKFVARLEVTESRGRDTRPSSRDEHEALHRRPGHEHSEH